MTSHSAGVPNTKHQDPNAAPRQDVKENRAAAESTDNAQGLSGHDSARHSTPSARLASHKNALTPSADSDTLSEQLQNLSVPPRKDAPVEPTSSPSLLPPPSLAPESSVGSPMSSAHANSPALHSSSALWTQPHSEPNDPFADTSARSMERDEILSVLEALHRCPAADLQTKLHLGGHLHRMLVEGTSASGPDRTHTYRDDFREAGGFLVVVQLISTLDHPQSQSDPDAHIPLQVEIFKLALSILSASLFQHPLNVKAFEATIGWKGLRDAITIAIGRVPADHIFGSLLGLALADISTYAGRISSVRRYLADHGSLDGINQPNEAASSTPQDLLEHRIRDQWTPVPTIVFPHAIRIGLQLLLASTTSHGKSAVGPLDTGGVQIVLHTLLRLVSTNRSNQIVLAGIGLSTMLLDAALPINEHSQSLQTSQNADGHSATAPIMASNHRDLLTEILRNLYVAAGIPDKDGRKLLIYLSTASSSSYRAAESPDDACDPVLDLLLDVASTSQQPNSVLFSMAEHGHASIAFSTLRRPFPPPPTSRGFTFVTTFSIERIEPSIPVELLTLFDSQRSFHVQLSIEPGTGLFSYTTSQLASSPPTRFNNVVFITGKRYHLVLVHLHPRGGAQMSPARLFVDGELVEEKLAPWPASSRGSAPTNASPASHIANPVRAVLGSPPGALKNVHHGSHGDLPQSRVNRLVWSLGPTMLLDDAVPNDLPLIFFELGPRYTGNAQDSLGRFLTYRASANVNLRLDQAARRPPAAATGAGPALSERDLANLPLVTAIAGRASDLVSEEKLYFVVNAANSATFHRSGGATSFGSDSTRKSGSRVLLNQAVPLNRDAVGSSFGISKMYGDPALLVPQPLDEMIWKLGGCAILLKLVANSQATETLTKALRLFLQLISQSWRLSEDMERCKGYEVLGVLLHSKTHLFSDEIATLIFEAVGVDVSGGSVHEASILVNPFLYRIVMLDFELWSQTSCELQTRHLKHFALLLRTSRHRRFNAKRVAKMQIIKKLTHAVRSDVYPADCTPLLTEALRALLASSFTDASVRIVTSFLAAQLCRTPATQDTTAPSTALQPRPKPQRAATMDASRLESAPATIGQRSLPTSSPSSVALSSGCTNVGLPHATLQALAIFEVLAQMLQERRSHLFRFADSVNAKWLMLFFHPQAERRAAELALQILARLLLQPELNYAQRLSTSGGFKVLERLLPRFWSVPSLFPLLWAALFGIEVPDPIPPLSELVPLPTQAQVRPVFCAPVLRAILSCLKEGMRLVASKQDLSRGGRFRVSRSRPSEISEHHASRSTTATPNDVKISATSFVSHPTSRPRHARKRSQSMNVDVKALEQAAQASSEIVTLQETAEPLRAYGHRSAEFRELLFSPIILRGLIDCIFLFVDGGSDTRPDISPGPSALNDRSATSTSEDVFGIADSLLGLLAQLTVDSLLSTHSIAILSAVDQALPPTDLAQQTIFRRALLAETTKKLRRVITKQPKHVKGAAEFIALFIETASEEILSGNTNLEEQLYQATLALLRILPLADGTSTKHETRAAATLYMSLNRILLLRFADVGRYALSLDEILQNQDIVLHSANQDLPFFQCLVNRLLHVLQVSSSTADENYAGELHIKAFTLFNLLALAKPTVVEGEPMTIFNELQQKQRSSGAKIGKSEATTASGTQNSPYEPVWNSISKSRETLKAAAHMERLQQLHDSLRRVDNREQVIANTENRMIVWHTSLVKAEDVRKAKFINDLREMHMFASIQWRELQAGLTRERALLAPTEASAASNSKAGKAIWRLDPTEGPDRIRLKLRQLDETDFVDTSVVAPQLAEPASETTMFMSPKAGMHGDPWDSTDAPIMDIPTSPPQSRILDSSVDPVRADRHSSLGDTDAAETSAESFHEDKFRRVLRSLERGDIIEAVFNTSRVVGIESRGCLLILGKLCVYLMDDYFQRPNGELINVWEAPAEERDALVMATLAGDASKPSDLIRELEGEAQTRKWTWSAVQVCHKRSWLHRRTAVEIFFEDGQSCLLVCPETATAQRMHRELQIRAPSAVASAQAMHEAIRERGGGSSGSSASSAVSPSGLGSRLAGAVLGRSSGWGAMATAWRDGRMSNFAYLMALNTLAGRSMNDLTQFPCFPWVLADYTSHELDLNNPATFRKLELPMGAQTPIRRKEFEERYVQLQEVDMEPFHYGTHYSTASTVCGYLIRTRPFERLLMALQGGNFDLADRTFGSIGKAWLSASELSRGDVRELIPEFFYLPEFLSNTNRFDFGITQSGEAIDDVELPPWAKNDPRLFILKHREALESEYVSQHLHHWIDLIFGYRSRGAEAVESTNVFHPLSYEDAVDLDSFESAMERQAAAQAIHNFGQTPSKLFNHPHPQRLRRLRSSLSASERFGLLEHPRLVVQSIAPIRTLKNAVHFIYPFHPEKALASPKDYLILPKLGISLSTDHLDGSLRMYSSRDTKRALAVVEQMMPDRITCIAQARAKSMVAGSSDGMVSVWELDGAKREVTLSNLLRGHDDAVLCVAASSAWSVVVTGSKDKTAIVWDLNRGTYVRSLRGHESGVHLVAIDEKTCQLATASGPEVRLWSVNGELLACLATSTNLSEPVSSLAFLERDYHVGRLAVLLTGHRGKVIAWEAVSAHATSASKKSTNATVRRSPSGALSFSNQQSRRVASEGSIHHQRSESTSWTGPLWRLAPMHVLEHHDRLGSEGSMEGSSSAASGLHGRPLITAIATTPKMILTGDEHGRLYQWTLVGEAVAVPDSFSSHCINSSCRKRFGMLDGRKICAGCGGLFCSACAVQHSEFSAQQRFCPHCHVVIDSSGYFDDQFSGPRS